MKQSMVEVAMMAHRKELTFAGPAPGLAPTAQKVAVIFRTELESRCAGCEFHVLSVTSDKNGLKDAGAVYYSDKSDDDCMTLQVTKAADKCDLDCASAVVGLKRRTRKIDDSAKGEKGKIEEKLRAVMKEKVGKAKNSNDATESQRLANHVQMDIIKAVKDSLPNVKWSIFVMIASAVAPYEISYSDTDGADFLRMEIRESGEEFNALAVVLGSPLA